MRTVFPNCEIPHKWAHQTQPSARGYGALSFEGPALYSYRTCVAYLHKRKGNTLALFSERRYSVTTSRHMNAAWRAAQHLAQETVPFVAPYAKDQHRTNFDYLLAEASACLGKAQRLRAPALLGFYQQRYDEQRAGAEHYARFFGLRWRVPARDDAAWAAAFARGDRLANPDPRSKDARERVAARRKQAQYATRRLAEIDRELARGRELYDVDQAERSDWRLHKAFGIRMYRWSYKDPVMLRLNDARTEIETSMGASVPVAAAPMVWRRVQEAIASGHDHFNLFRKRSHIRIGDYPLDRIDADGTLHAGCHTIPYSELRTMARTLGLIERGQQ